jgi:hypothetical protein
MLFNDVLGVTGDLGAAMAAIHDTDLRVASRYLQGRDDRVREAFAVLDGGQFPETNTQLALGRGVENATVEKVLSGNELGMRRVGIEPTT